MIPGGDVCMKGKLSIISVFLLLSGKFKHIMQTFGKLQPGQKQSLKTQCVGHGYMWKPYCKFQIHPDVATHTHTGLKSRTMICFQLQWKLSPQLVMSIIILAKQLVSTNRPSGAWFIAFVQHFSLTLPFPIKDPDVIFRACLQLRGRISPELARQTQWKQEVKLHFNNYFLSL